PRQAFLAEQRIDERRLANVGAAGEGDLRRPLRRQEFHRRHPADEGPGAGEEAIAARELGPVAAQAAASSTPMSAPRMASRLRVIFSTGQSHHATARSLSTVRRSKRALTTLAGLPATIE